MESVRVVSLLSRKECEERLRRALEREQEKVGDRRFIAPDAPTRVLERLMNIVRDARQGGTGTDNVDIAIGGRWSRGGLGLWVTRVVQGVPSANAFAPRLFAQLVESGDRTILDVHIRMLRFVRWFLVSCVAIILVGEAVILYGLAAGWERHGSVWLIAIVPLGVVVGILGLLRFSQWLARGDSALLLRFVKEAVDGTVESETRSLT